MNMNLLQLLAFFVSNLFLFGNSNLIPEYFNFIGRFDISNGQAKAEWPGSAIIFSFQSNNSTSEITLTLDCSNTFNFYVDVSVNCMSWKKVLLSSVCEITLEIPTFPSQVNEVKITKITESYCGDSHGVMSITDIKIGGGGFLVKADNSCQTKKNRLLIVGDSITAAYGVEGAFPCSFTAETENVLYSYATIVGNDIDADVHTIAWSGKGVVRNYGDVNPTSTDPMPVYYNRTLATSESSIWRPSDYVPDVVLVMLGTNDYSTTPNPTDESFITGLVNLLSIIRDDYPLAKIAAMCAPSNVGKQCMNIKKAALQTGNTYIYIDQSAFVSYGCDYHPSIETQQNIAKVVTSAVKNMLR
jgi:hypothetical protein